MNKKDSLYFNICIGWILKNTSKQGKKTSSTKSNTWMDVEKKFFLEKCQCASPAFTLFLSIFYRYKIEFKGYLTTNYSLKSTGTI